MGVSGLPTRKLAPVLGRPAPAAVFQVLDAGMSESEHDPHVLVSARANESPKIVDLPSDRARWGWVVMLGKAKLQRPPGRFASRRLLDAVLGEYRRFVPDYIRVGILEEIEGGAIAVHDFDVNQSRTTVWRRRVGLANGHGNLSGNDGETDGETTGKLLHAGARVMQSQSQSQSDTPEQEEPARGDEPDAAVALQQRTGTFPSERILTWLNELGEQHSETRLVAAIGGTPLAGRNVKDYLVAVRDKLRLEDHAADKAERLAERARVAEQRRVNIPLLRSYHNNGAHLNAPDPRCPLCSEDAA